MHFDPLRNPASASRRPIVTALARPHRPAFTLIELMVVMGIIIVLASLILATIARTRNDAQQVRCLANLRSIATAFQLYSADNETRFPVPQLRGQSWESMLQKYVGSASTFQCPADTEIFPEVGSSYDWRSNYDPLSSLSGKKWTDPIRGDAVLAYETLGGWHRRHEVNAVRCDGSALPMTEDSCFKDVLDPVLIGTH